MPRQGGHGGRQSTTTASSAAQSALGGTRHFNNIRGRTAIGQPDRERLEVYATDVLANTKEFTRVYVEGIPKRVTLTGHYGIPDIIQNVEQILNWPLVPETCSDLAAIVSFREYPTEHGSEADGTYAASLQILPIEVEGRTVYPHYGMTYSSNRERQWFSRPFITERSTTVYTVHTTTAVPCWVTDDHFQDSDKSMLVTKVRGATICPTGNGDASRCMDAEAYINRLLITVVNLLTSITEDMPSRPQ